MKTHLLLFPLLLLLSGPAAGQAPVLDTLSDASLVRSGRLRLFGSSFGTTQGPGRVLVGGSEAIVTTWTGVEIHAYVPEAAPFGPVEVVVETGGGTSAALPLVVTPRQPDGRVAWRFEIDSRAASRHRVGIGPDGTVYVDEGFGLVYAVSSDGGLRWVYDTRTVVDGGAADGPIEVAADGTVYVGANPLGPDTTIHAVRPDGTARWVFTATGGQGIIAGPGVGPDGNVYAVLDNAASGSLGVFSLDQDGNLRWSDPADPPVNEHGQLGQAIAFGPDRLYFGFDEYGVAGPAFFGFTLDGDQRFAFSGPADHCGPVAAPDGTVYVRLGGGPGVMSALDPEGGLAWQAPQPAPNNTLLNPVLGPDGTIYTARNLDDFWALNPDGSTRWYLQDPAQGIMGNMGVSPDNAVILDGGRETYGMPGWIKAYSTGDGTLLWQIDLPDEGGTYGDVVTNGPPGFTPDGARAYYVAIVLGVDPANERSYLYAVDLHDVETGPGTAVCFGDGSGAGCPCGNESSVPGEGCAHSGGVGMTVASAGTASLGRDDLVLTAAGCPAGNAGIFYAGTSLGAGNGLFDGLQCAGGDVRRFRGLFQADGTASDTGFVAQDPSGVYFQAGVTFHFQYWTRDAAAGASPCASFANLSPAWSVTMQP